ncbi:MAG TPA: DUF3516 domain-containing protein, partial [Microlunatus sp.]|nr:DUF3516 domain-containing protein [Microlunatus sp.]
NLKALAKAGDDPKKRRKVVRKKPPEGTVGYAEPTYERLVGAAPEPLESSFAVTHAMVINVISRSGSCWAAMKQLLVDNDETPRRRRKHVHDALTIYRGLLQTGVVERLEQPDDHGRLARLTVDLQPDFALNQPLSPFALAAVDLLDPDADDYHLDVLSVIESILEDPRPVLSAQRSMARGEAVEAMKREGLEYEERMELLEDVTYPQPLRELLDVGYRAYASSHPWVLDHVLAPKSVARDLLERSMTFTEYVALYRLARAEGLVLRYLADAYKALRQTIPESKRTEALEDLIAWLGELVRQTDSSLLDEWEKLRNPDPEAELIAESDRRPPAVTSNLRAFTVLVRNALFRRVELAARRRWFELGELDGDAGWGAPEWETAMAGYFAEHTTIQTGADARGPALLVIDRQATTWQVRQVLDDPDGDHDYSITAEVDLAASDDAGEAVVRLTGVGRTASW